MLEESDIDGYFRAGIGACLLNGRNEILIMRRTDFADSWQMPQGGIKQGEKPRQALAREVLEETGLTVDDYRVVSATEWITYELPTENRSSKTGRGQTQRWFQCLVKDGIEIVPDQDEFNAFQWVKPKEAIDLAVDFRKDAYTAIIDSFSLH